MSKGMFPRWCSSCSRRKVAHTSRSGLCAACWKSPSLTGLAAIYRMLKGGKK